MEFMIFWGAFKIGGRKMKGGDVASGANGITHSPSGGGQFSCCQPEPRDVPKGTREDWQAFKKAIAGNVKQG